LHLHALDARVRDAAVLTDAARLKAILYSGAAAS
jgi:hypothetical protein